MLRTLIFLSLIFSVTLMTAQTTDSLPPYHQIPDYPESFEAGDIVSRMIDGLGYRYYWATEGLLEEDLAWKASEDSRTALETLEHLLGLSETIVNGCTDVPNIRPVVRDSMGFEEMRIQTLNNILQASKAMLSLSAAEVEKKQLVFKREDRESAFPYWHMLNGPIADALYHTGQIVAFRRASGNPMHFEVNVFMGKTGK